MPTYNTRPTILDFVGKDFEIVKIQTYNNGVTWFTNAEGKSRSTCFQGERRKMFRREILDPIRIKSPKKTQPRNAPGRPDFQDTRKPKPNKREEPGIRSMILYDPKIVSLTKV